MKSPVTVAQEGQKGIWKTKSDLEKNSKFQRKSYSSDAKPNVKSDFHFRNGCCQSVISDKTVYDRYLLALGTVSSVSPITIESKI